MHSVKKKIGPFDWTLSEECRKEFHQLVDQILDRAFLSNDILVNRLEKAFSQWSQSGDSVAVSNGTSALELAFKSIGVKGKKVVVPANTFIATAIAVINAGGIPVIVDIEDDYFSICPRSLERVLEKHKDVAAVCHVHIGGHVSHHFYEVLEMVKRYELPLVEDACHGLGAQLDGRLAGGFGDYGCFSFYLTKVMTSAEGGMVISGHSEKLRRLRQFGVSEDNALIFDELGSNYKMSELNAALGIVELERLNQRIQARRERAKVYQTLLADSSFVAIGDSALSRGSYYKQIVLSQRHARSEVAKALEDIGVALTGGVYYVPLHRQPIMRQYCEPDKFSVSDQFSNSHFCPPCYPEVSLEEVEQICNQLLKLDKA